MNKNDFIYGCYQRTTIKNTYAWINDLNDQFLLDCNKDDIKNDSEARRCYKYLNRKIKQIEKIRKKECEVLVL